MLHFRRLVCKSESLFQYFRILVQVLHLLPYLQLQFPQYLLCRLQPLKCPQYYFHRFVALLSVGYCCYSDYSVLCLSERLCVDTNDYHLQGQ